MDPVRFDGLARSLSGSGTRRRMMRLLTGLPLAVGITSLHADVPDARAEDDDHGSSHRRHRRKTRNARRSGDDKENRKGQRKGRRKDKKTCVKRSCTAGSCGSQPDGCGGTLNCRCAGNQRCHGGTCQPCDVPCLTGNPTICGEALRAAIAAASSDDTIRICAGTYGRTGTAAVVEIGGKNLHLIGAGTESGGTILDGEDVASGETVVRIHSGANVQLENLSVTGANGRSGILNQSTLTLTGVLVTGNRATASGGGIFNQGPLTLNAGTLITDNEAVSNNGGGIFNNGGVPLTLNAGAAVTKNRAGFGGGIQNTGDDHVTLNVDSVVCDNVPNDCVGFADPNGVCQPTCPS
jgi:hypothetical protein